MACSLLRFIDRASVYEHAPILKINALPLCRYDALDEDARRVGRIDERYGISWHCWDTRFEGYLFCEDAIAYF